MPIVFVASHGILCSAGMVDFAICPGFLEACALSWMKEFSVVRQKTTSANWQIGSIAQLTDSRVTWRCLDRRYYTTTCMNLSWPCFALLLSCALTQPGTCSVGTSHLTICTFASKKYLQANVRRYIAASWNCANSGLLVVPIMIYTSQRNITCQRYRHWHIRALPRSP